MNESFGITKTTQNNKTGTIGEELVFPINFQNGLGRARQFNNARVIDVLPQGVTYVSTYPKLPRDPAKEDFTVVDNFMGSGRQAIIYSLGNILASELPSKNFNLYAKINDKATPADFHTAIEDNMNYVYFTADNWKTLPEGVDVKTLLPDELNLNGNGTDKNVLGSKSTFTALLPTDVTGVKYVRAGTEGEWSLQPVYVDYDSPYQYKLTIRNNENDTLTEATIYDILPFNGDTYYNYDEYLEGYPDRGSAFSGLMTGPINAPQGFTVMYRTDSYMPPNPDAGINDTQAWRTEAQIGTNWERVRGFKIQTNPGTEIPPYSTTEFIVNMKTRSFVLENNLNNQTSNNIFAVRYNNRGFGQSNMVSIHLTQTINVNKVWDGGPQEDRDQSVHVQLYRDGAIMPGRTIELNKGNDWEAAFGNLQVYSPFGKLYTYTVQETNAPPNYESTVTGNQSDGFTITNRYVSPEITITGTKIWDGGPNPDDYRVALQLYRWIGDGDYTNGPDGADPKDEFDANGLIAKEAVGSVHYVTAGNEVPWSSSKDNPRYNKDGVEYNYVIREVLTPFTKWDHPEHYTQTINESTNAAGNLQYGVKQYDVDGNLTGWSFDITNKYVPPIDDILTSKVWVGGDYAYPKILIDLYRYKEGQQPEEAEKVLDGISSATTNLSPYHIYKNQPLTDKEDGVPYIYRIEEVDLSKLTPEEMAARGISQADVDQFANYVSMRNFANDPLGVNDPNLSIINEYVAPRLIVEGTKTWVGGDAANRPDVTFQLMQNGEKYAPKQTLIGTGVPGSLISVNFNHTTMVHPDGKWYIEFATSVAKGTTFNIVQTERGKAPSAPVVSVDGTPVAAGQPVNEESATLGVTSFATPANPITIKDDGSEPQTAVWDVPRTDFFEQEYKYEVIEINVPDNYTDTYAEPVELRNDKGKLTKLSQEITNTYTPDTIQVTANKEWKGGPDVKPGYEFQLYRITGTDEATKIAVGAPMALLTQTSHTWDVPEKNADGILYTYFVEESTPPANYTASYKTENGIEDKLTIVNTFTPEDLTIPVQKVWMGGSVDERPTTVTVNLYNGDEIAKDGEGEVLTLTLDADGQWMGEFTNVPAVGEDLNPITYKVKEVEVPGFTVSYEGDQERGFRVINTYEQETKDVTATKVWDGGENVAGATTRPSVQLQLQRNLVNVGAPVWVDGVVETKVGDEAVVDGKTKDYTVTYEGMVVTNTFGSTEFAVHAEKVWVGEPEADHIAPELVLYQNGEALDVDPAITPAEGTADKFIYTWNVIKTDDFGQDYRYVVDELTTPEGYGKKVEVDVNGKTTITNTFASDLTDISMNKIWVGGPKEHPDITVQLVRKTEADLLFSIVDQEELKNPDNFHIWKAQPLKDGAGNAYEYKVIETSIGTQTVTDNSTPDYTVEYTGDINNGFTITNTFAAEQMTVEAIKIWVGGDEEDHIAPEFVLYQNGKVHSTIAPTGEDEDGDATYSWTVPKTDEFGQAYTYAVDEANTPEGYGKSIEVRNGVTLITNTFDAEVTDISVHKDWFGGAAPYPAITFELQRRIGNDDFETVATEVLPTGDHIHIWKDMPLTDDADQAYEYRVIESRISDTLVIDNKALTYAVTYGGSVAEGFTVTNTSVNDLQIPVTKVWVDDNNARNTRPAQITLIAVRDDGVEKSQVFTVNDENLYTITGLEEFKPNSTEKYTYTIVEVAVRGYETIVEGTTVTNTLMDETNVTFIKEWVGGPAVKPNITVGLRANGQLAVHTDGKPVADLTLANGAAKGTFENLPVFDKEGKIIEYTVVELSIGSTLVLDGKAGNFTVAIEQDADCKCIKITNTFVADKTAVDVEKKWAGGTTDTQVPVTIQLFRQAKGENKEFVGEGVVLDAANNWKHRWTEIDLTNASGEAYVYSVAELDVPENYRATVAGSGTANDPFVVTNTFTTGRTEITAFKRWVGGPIAKPDVILTLHRHTNAAQTPVPVPAGLPLIGLQNPITLKDGQVGYTWKNLPTADADGNAYTYTVTENGVENYTTRIDGMVVTNTFQGEDTIFRARKVWVGGNEADHTAPEFVLYQNGRVSALKPTVTPVTGTAQPSRMSGPSPKRTTSAKRITTRSTKRSHQKATASRLR